MTVLYGTFVICIIPDLYNELSNSFYLLWLIIHMLVLYGEYV